MSTGEIIVYVMIWTVAWGMAFYALGVKAGSQTAYMRGRSAGMRIGARTDRGK
jgi:ethanolamine transporter EutH